MPDQFPNANYPEPYAEADMVKATDVATNADGGLLTVTEVGAGSGPLTEHAVTVDDVEGTSLHDSKPQKLPESPATEDE